MFPAGSACGPAPPTRPLFATSDTPAPPPPQCAPHHPAPPLSPTHRACRVNGNLNLSRAIGDLKYKASPELPAKDQVRRGCGGALSSSRSTPPHQRQRLFLWLPRCWLPGCRGAVPPWPVARAKSRSAQAGPCTWTHKGHPSKCTLSNAGLVPFVTFPFKQGVLASCLPRLGVPCRSSLLSRTL